MRYAAFLLSGLTPRRAGLPGVWALLFGLCLLLLSRPAAAQTLLQIGGATRQEVTDIQLLFSEPVIYKIFTLDNPSRVVIDVPDVKWRAGRPALSQSAPLVSQIRHALFRPGQRRIVLDLAAPIQSPQWQAVTMDNGQFILTLSLTSRSGWHAPPGEAPPPAVEEAPSATVAEPQAPPGDLLAIIPVFKPEIPAYWATFRFQGVPRDILVVTPAFKPLEMCIIPPVVVIDAGHGGKDPGAISPSGNREKNVVLTYARALQQALNKTGRYRAELTRGDDRFLGLRERIAIAKRMKGDIFISLHADAAVVPEANGFSIYTLSEQASDSEAAMLASRENKADILLDVDLSHESQDVASILIDLAQRETKNKSSELAEAFVEHMRPFASLRKHTHRYAGFAVLKLPDIPSVLAELGFLSNKEDEQKLLNADYQKKMVDAMVRSVDRYFRKYEPGLFH